MISRLEFVRQSLETHLFFGRIMKEHAFFLQVGFTPKNQNYIEQADEFRREFDALLGEVIMLSGGVVSAGVLQSGEVITPYTIQAEMVSSYYTGVRIPVQLTQQEASLVAGNLATLNPSLEQRVMAVNGRAIAITNALIQLKADILADVLSCKMYTGNYPLLIDHIMREAKLYVRTIQRLQNRERVDFATEALEQEAFWNRIMAEHAKFIRGLLDPSEEDLIKTAENFGKEFDKLSAEALAAMDKSMPKERVTEESLKATGAIRLFKAKGTEGLLSCKIKSIILPLLGDHVFREASHFLRLLKQDKKT